MKIIKPEKHRKRFGGKTFVIKSRKIQNPATAEAFSTVLPTFYVGVRNTSQWWLELNIT